MNTSTQNLKILESFCNSMSTSTIANIRLNFMTPTRFTQIRPYWIEPPIDGRSRNLTDDQILEHMPKEYAERCLKTVAEMEEHLAKLTLEGLSHTYEPKGNQ